MICMILLNFSQTINAVLHLRGCSAQLGGKSIHALRTIL